MPTSLPENFSGSAPLEPDRKAVRKVARKLALQSLLGIAKGLALHYGIALAGVAVIAASGFHGVPRAALSVTVIGLLARWFLPNSSRTKADALRQQPGYVELTPAQLSDFMSKLGQPDAHQDAAPEGVAKTSPYL